MSAANTEKWREMPLSTKHKNKGSRKTKLQKLLLIFSVLVTEQNIQLADLIMLHLFVTDHRLEGHSVCSSRWLWALSWQPARWQFP